jgi:hypothetical protein
MLRVNDLPPEQMPTHHRDFPRQAQPEIVVRTSDSHGLLLLVCGYLVALFAGILLLGHLTASPHPTAATMAASATLTK